MQKSMNICIILDCLDSILLPPMVLALVLWVFPPIGLASIGWAKMERPSKDWAQPTGQSYRIGQGMHSFL
jgi:hypothetical protein